MGLDLLYSRLRILLRVCLLVSAASLLLSVTELTAESRVIALTDSTLEQVGIPSINASGEVAFFGKFSDGSLKVLRANATEGNYSIFAEEADGYTFTDEFFILPEEDNLPRVSIDDLGNIYFMAIAQTFDPHANQAVTGSGWFSGPNPDTDILSMVSFTPGSGQDTAALLNNSYWASHPPSVNNSQQWVTLRLRQVATTTTSTAQLSFKREPEDTRFPLYGDVFGASWGANPSNPQIGRRAEPGVINNLGQMLVPIVGVDFKYDLFLSDPSDEWIDQVLLDEFNFADRYVIIDTEILDSVDLPWGSIRLSDNGDIAFTAEEKLYTGTREGISRYDTGTSFYSIRSSSLSPSGDLIFAGDSSVEGFRFGIYDGPDLNEDSILDSRATVEDLDLAETLRWRVGAEAINDTGQIVFKVTLFDEREAIIFTTGEDPPDPDPEPIEGHRWVNANGGEFSVAANWDDFDGNEITDDVPGASDTAIFDLPAAYTVDVGTRSIEQLVVGGDPATSVSFTNAGLSVNSSSVDPAAVIIDNGNFQLVDGTINSTFATIGRSSASIVEIDGSGSTWTNTGRFTVGKAGEADVGVVNGATFEAGETFVGTDNFSDTSQSSLWARDSGSTIHLGNAQIGIGSLAEVYAESGGRITGEEGRLALLSGAAAVLRASDSNPATGDISRIELERLKVGFGGDGFLNVLEGSEVVIPRLTIGQLSGGLAQVVGSGSLLQSNFFLSVGGLTSILNEQVEASAIGNLWISEGGQVIAGELLDDNTPSGLGMLVGSTGKGLVSVDGETGLERSTLKVLGGMLVGVEGGRVPPEYDGELEILNGAKVEADFVTVAFDDGSSGFVGVNGENTNRNEVSELLVSADLDIGGKTPFSPSAGFGQMIVEAGGTVLVDGAINIGNSNPGELEVTGLRPSSEDLGSTVSANSIRVGRVRPGVLRIDERGQVESFFMELGTALGFYEDEQPRGEVVISNGGQLEVGELALNKNFDENASGLVIVQGVSDVISATIEAGTVIVGPHSELQVLDQGYVETQDLTIEGSGQVFVEGDGGLGDRPSRILVTNDLVMGGSFGNESFLAIDDDSEVEVQGNITYTTGARMCIDGTLTSDQVFAAGFLELGCSLGTAIIDGNFTLGPTGTLEIEIMGPTPVDEHDTLIVLGDVDLQGTVRFVFSGYAPQQGETFSILDPAGTLTNTGSRITFIGLKDGFEANFSIVENTMTLTALNDGALRTADDPIQLLDSSYSVDTGLNISLFGIDQISYNFESSTDLEAWELISEVTGENNLLEFRSILPEGEDRRFYRVVQDPES